MKDLLDLLKNRRNLVNLLVLGILILGLPVAAQLVRQQQILRSGASGEKVEFLEGGCVASRNNSLVATCPDVTIKLTPPLEFLTNTKTAQAPQLQTPLAMTTVKNAYAAQNCMVCDGGKYRVNNYADYKACKDAGASTDKACDTNSASACYSPADLTGQDCGLGQSTIRTDVNLSPLETCTYLQQCGPGFKGTQSCTGTPDSSGVCKYNEKVSTSCSNCTVNETASGTGGTTTSSAGCIYGPADSVTQDQAKCVLDKRGDILPYYKQQSWCSQPIDYPGIVNNWLSITSQAEKDAVASCFGGTPPGTNPPAVSNPGSNCMVCDGGKYRLNNDAGGKACKDQNADPNKGCDPNTSKACYSDKDLTGQACDTGNKALSLNCMVCDGGKYRVNNYAGGKACQDAKADPNKTCDPKSPETCYSKNDLTGQTCGAGNTPTGPVEYRLAENPADLAQAKYVAWPSTGVINYTFQPPSLTDPPIPVQPGTKFIWVQFKQGSSETQTFNAKINYVGADPVISAISCNLDISTNKLVFNMAGKNFGTEDHPGKVAAGSSNLAVTNWGDGNVEAALANVTAKQDGQEYKVTLTRYDGQPVSTKCTVGVSTIALAIKPICGLTANGLPDVTVTVKPATENAQPVTEKVTIDKDGVIQGLKTNLQAGLKYFISIKAPKYLRRTTEITAQSGTTVIPDLVFPWGDIAPSGGDGKINSVDKASLNQQWGLVGSATSKNCDCNNDGVCNSFEWGFMSPKFNDTDQPLP